MTEPALLARLPDGDDPDARTLHLLIDARFRTGLYRGPAEPGELRAEANGIALFMDPFTASRAEGLTLDAEQTPNGPAFRIDNPNAPAGAAGP